MNLLIINDQGLYGGGTEQRIELFIQEALKRKFFKEIHIVQKYSPPQQKDLDSVFFHTIPKNEIGYYFVQKIIQKHHINIVQAHNLLATHPFLILAVTSARIPLFWWAHDYWLLCAKRSFIDPFHAKIEKLCMKASGGSCHKCMNIKTRLKYLVWQKIMNLADMAIAPSSILQEIHEKNNILKKRWIIVTPWVDPYYFEYHNPKKKKKEKILLFVGSLIEFKGAWVAAQALKKIVHQFPETKLIFVGSEQDPYSRYRQEIKQICTKDKTIQHITFLGKKTKEELATLYAQADIYLCPTVCMESFGLNWAQAMACGCPVIASMIGSIPEYIEPYETGLLFTPRNHEDLAQQILTLFSNPILTKKIAIQGKIYALEHFSVKKSTDTLLRLYQEKLKI